MTPQPTSSDAERIRQLERAGSDLSKVHRITFSLRFPGEDAALQVLPQLEELAFVATAEQDADGSWVVLAVKNMYPREPDLAGLRDKLNAIAAQAGGTYEGWQGRQRD